MPNKNLEPIEDTQPQEPTAAPVEPPKSEWQEGLEATIENLKTLIEDQAKTIADQTSQIEQMTKDFETKTANLVKYGVPTFATDSQPVEPGLNTPYDGYTPMIDLDFLPVGFREGKDPYVRSF